MDTWWNSLNKNEKLFGVLVTTLSIAFIVFVVWLLVKSFEPPPSPPPPPPQVIEPPPQVAEPSYVEYPYIPQYQPPRFQPPQYQPPQYQPPQYQQPPQPPQQPPQPPQQPQPPPQPPSTQPKPPVKNNLSDKDRWVEAHNFYRRKHCVPELTWNADAAQKAQAWAQYLIDHNEWRHPASNERSVYIPNMGQNLARDVNASRNIEDTVSSWYEEVSLPNVIGYDSRMTDQQYKQTISDTVKKERPSNCPGIAYIYGQDSCNPNHWYGHFTQVVWKGSAQIGCGIATDKKGTYISACNYAPTGNIIGRFTQNVVPLC